MLNSGLLSLLLSLVLLIDKVLNLEVDVNFSILAFLAGAQPEPVFVFSGSF
jgi:hypothetical protein